MSLIVLIVLFALNLLTFARIPPDLIPLEKQQTPKPELTMTEISLQPTEFIEPLIISSGFPSDSMAAATSPKPGCGLNVHVPVGNCANEGNIAVQQTIIKLKQELDKSWQQNQAQNAAVQSMITQLQSQQSRYLNKISDLQNEVENLFKAFDSVSGFRSISTSPLVTNAPTFDCSNALFEEVVQSIRDDLTRAVSDFNTKTFNLSFLMQESQLQELKVHQNIETQIQKQAEDIGRLSQQVKDLNSLLQLLTASLGDSEPSASNADIVKLQAEINKVANAINAFDQRQQSQLTSLNMKTSHLSADVENLETEHSGLNTRLVLMESQVKGIENDILVVHDALAMSRKDTLPKLGQLEADLVNVTATVTKVQTDIKNVGRSASNMAEHLGTDIQLLNGLKMQTTQIKTSVSNIETDLNTQDTEINNIKKGIVSLKKAIPISELNQMNNIIILMRQGETPNTAELRDLNSAITSIMNKLEGLTIAE